MEKKRQLRVKFEENSDSKVMDLDDDRFWKGGLIYMNKQDLLFL